MPHILFVCTANICRSPLAAGVLRHRLQQEGLEEWTVRSAGTWATAGRAAADNSIDILADQGIDISNHRSRMIDSKIVKGADLILVMEKGHAEALRVEFPEAAGRIYLLSEMIGRRYGISDPYGAPLSRYERMAADVTEIIDKGLPRIIELAQANAEARAQVNAE